MEKWRGIVWESRVEVEKWRRGGWNSRVEVEMWRRCWWMGVCPISIEGLLATDSRDQIDPCLTEMI